MSDANHGAGAGLSEEERGFVDRWRIVAEKNYLWDCKPVPVGALRKFIAIIARLDASSSPSEAGRAPSPASPSAEPASPAICSAPTDVCEGSGKGCGREIPRGEEYRCLDCGGVMHKDCLRWHCSGDEKDRRIWSLEGHVKELQAQIERLCAEPASPSDDELQMRVRHSSGCACMRDSTKGCDCDRDALIARLSASSPSPASEEAREPIAFGVVHEDGTVIRLGFSRELLGRDLKRWPEGESVVPLYRATFFRARSTPTPETSEPAHPSSGRTD